VTLAAAASGLVSLDLAAGASSPAPPIRPRVLAVHPGLVRGAGGSRIVVLGDGFSAGVRVTVGGLRAPVVAVRNAHALIALAPPGIGTEVVRAITSGGTSASNGRSVIQYANRVLVVGDSLGIDLEWGFTPQLDARNDLSVVDDAFMSSGLVRSDYYDWPSHLRADIAQLHPDIVFALFGTNDQQAIGTTRGLAEPDTPAWDRAYAARVREIGAIVHGAGANLVWVGLPRMGPQSVLSQQYVANLVALDRRVVLAMPAATYVDSWQVFTTPKGGYTPYVELSPHLWEPGHQPDGTHLTPAGAAVLDALGVASLDRLLHR
jgi:hypothetical protein